LPSLPSLVSLGARYSYVNLSHFILPRVAVSLIRRRCSRASYPVSLFVLPLRTIRRKIFIYYGRSYVTSTAVSSLAEKVRFLQKKGEWKEAWRSITEEQLKQSDMQDIEEMWKLKAEILETLQWDDELRRVINNDVKFFGEKQAQPYIFKCRGLMSGEKYREALVVIEDALLSHPNNNELLVLLVECLLRLNIRISEVQRILAQFRAQNPSDVSIIQKQIETLQKLQIVSANRDAINNLLLNLCNEYLRLQPTASIYAIRGKIYLSRNEFSEALSDFTAGLKLIPQNQPHEIQYLLAKMIAKDDPNHALDLLQNYCFSSSEINVDIVPEAYLLGGDIAFDLYRYRLAHSFYSAAYRKQPSPEAKYGQARCYILQGKVAQAQPLIEELLQRDCNNPHYMLLHSFLSSKNPSLILDVLNNLLHIHPKCHHARVEKAVILYYVKHDVVQAVNEIDVASRIVSDPEAHVISFYKKKYIPKVKLEVQEEIRQLHQSLEKALQEERINEALAYCNKILSLDPRNVVAWQQRYAIYSLLYKGDANQSLEQLIEYDSIEYSDVEYAHMFCSRFFSQNFKTRNSYLERALVLNPYDPAIAEAAARSYMEQNDYDTAAVHLLRAIGGNNPQPAQLLTLLASCLLHSATTGTKNYVDLSFVLLERSLSLQATEEAYLLKASILIQKEQFDEALQVYNAVLSLKPRSVFALIGKAQIYNSKKQYDDALKCAEAAIPFSQGKTKQTVLRLKMTALRGLNRSEEAFQVAQELLTLNPEDTSALTIVTSYFVSKRDYDSALKYLDKIKNPSKTILEIKLGVYIAMHDLDKILCCCNEILQKDPKHPQALSMKRTALMELNRWDEVEVICEKILETQPKDISTLLVLVRAYEMNKKPRQALERLRQATELAPNEARVWAQGGTLFMMRREFEKALEYLDRAIALDPKNVRFVLSKAQALFELDKPDEAYKYFLDAVKMSPNSSEPWFEIAVFYHRLGLLKKAVECYEKCLSIQPKHERARQNCAKAKTLLQNSLGTSQGK
jgi:tetratricopeptide (TPR) repeat protein